MNRTLLDMARCLLLQSGLSTSFWSEAIATACHIRNRCPISSLDGKISYEKWTGNRTKVHYLRTFGLKVHVLDKSHGKDKLAQRSVESVFVGYPRDRKGFRVWMPSTRQIIYARDVKFLEETQKVPRDACVLDEFLTSVEKAEANDNNSPRTVEFSPQLLKINEASAELPVTPETRVQPEEESRRAPGRPRLLRTGSRERPRKLYRSTHAMTLDEEETQ